MGQPAAQATPPLPHAGAAWHWPSVSQHPLGQLFTLHTQWPPLHVWPVPHVVPQPPQFESSVDSFTHAVPHGDRPAPHARAQLSPLQLAEPAPLVGPGQLVPHWVPQLFGSVFETQAALAPLPQRCSPALHENPQTPPALHVGVPPVTPGQTLVQLPQWLGSVTSFTHAPVQRLRPVVQPDEQPKVAPASSTVGEQFGVPPEQIVLHPPQWPGWLMSVSQPLSGLLVQMP
jgi:hypothetical protein